MVVILVVILGSEDRRRFFSQSCSILFKIRDSRLLPFSHNCFWLWEFFSPVQSNSGVFFSLFHPKAIISDLFILSFQLSFSNLTGASFKWSLISSWSLRSHVSSFSQASSFICKFFPVIHYLLFVHFQFLRWFVQDSSSHIIILPFFQILPVVHRRPLQVCALSILILSNYFEVVILVNPFNYISAISLSNHSTVFLLSGP